MNGSTRNDYTNYIASAPVSALDAILWLEADRMKHLDFSEKNLKNQQEVVKEEIRVNVKNRPYGLFFWTDLVAKAFDKWENNHDGYGSFEDLDAADLKDVETFFGSYYGPNNAVMGIVGDVTPEEVFARAEKYFGALPARALPPPADLQETLNTAERTLEQKDPLARVPAVAVGYKLPAGIGNDYVALVVLGDVLLNGEASRLYQGLVKGKELMLQVQGGVNFPFESPWRNSGPTLLSYFGLYKPGTDVKAVVEAAQAEIAQAGRIRDSRHGPRPRQDQDAVGLLLGHRAAHQPCRRPGPGPAPARRRQRPQRDPGPDRRGDGRRPSACGLEVPDRAEPDPGGPPAGARRGEGRVALMKKTVAFLARLPRNPRPLRLREEAPAEGPPALRRRQAAARSADRPVEAAERPRPSGW